MYRRKVCKNVQHVIVIQANQVSMNQFYILIHGHQRIRTRIVIKREVQLAKIQTVRKNSFPFLLTCTYNHI